VPATIAVALEGVSKRFILHRRPVSGLKERLIDAARTARAGASRRGGAREELWALRDVTLAVAAGETLGLIGANGSGKSTLLQIIGGIHAPDAGEVRTTGRVTSLLELGAGFSPDLTGRENVFLNASLYGVPAASVRSRLDAIVSYAELERFIDTPVRGYSSGMYVRLGFAVAVHLDPEILLVDEALAVGDEQFQRKCLATLRDFRERGVTIVVVSHDLRLVEQLASRVCLLDGGRLMMDGPPAETIAQYHELAAGSGGTGGRRWGTGAVEITAVELIDRAGAPASVFRTREPLTIRLRYRAKTPVDRPVFGIALHHESGAHVSGPNTKMSGMAIESVAGEGAIEYRVATLPLLPGRYLVSAAVYDRDLVTPFDHRDRFLPLTVVEGGTNERFGLVELQATWHWP
jgi:ABC-type polysaccharide/polyol phosphate transport system ATPase subunit